MQIKTTVRYYLIPVKISSVQFSYSVVSDFVTPMTAAHQASLYITNSQSLPKLISIESMMPSKHLILCRPFLLQPSIFSSIRDFSNESVFCIKWPKYWSFSLNISSLPAQDPKSWQFALQHRPADFYSGSNLMSQDISLISQ